MSVRDAFRRLSLRVRALAARRRVDRDIDDELAFHLELEARKHVDAGLTSEDAHARARARFGSPSIAAEDCRDAGGTRFLDHLTQDLAYALRTVRRMPGVAITIVGTVALGLALVAAAFTIFNVFVSASRPCRIPTRSSASTAARPRAARARAPSRWSRSSRCAGTPRCSPAARRG